MADENVFRTSTMPPARSGVRTRAVIGTALLAFVLGGAAVGYAVWQGLVPPALEPAARLVEPPAPRASTAPASQPKVDPVALAGRQDALEARAAALAERFDSLDLAANAAAGNAARAEALLVALAARRALDRGVPLGLLEDQLRLRFGNAQPNAVAVVIDTAREPVTLDQLVAGLDALAPGLTAAPRSAGTWERIKQELGGLFVIRRGSAPTTEPQAILRRARLLLEEGRSTEAMAEVRRLPGAADATAWLASVKRYDGARRALDVLETTALIEPRGLRDARGGSVGTTTATTTGPVRPGQPAAAPAALPATGLGPVPASGPAASPTAAR